MIPFHYYIPNGYVLIMILLNIVKSERSIKWLFYEIKGNNKTFLEYSIIRNQLYGHLVTLLFKIFQMLPGIINWYFLFLSCIWRSQMNIWFNSIISLWTVPITYLHVTQDYHWDIWIFNYVVYYLKSSKVSLDKTPLSSFRYLI